MCVTSFRVGFARIVRLSLHCPVVRFWLTLKFCVQVLPKPRLDAAWLKFVTGSKSDNRRYQTLIGTGESEPPAIAAGWQTMTVYGARIATTGVAALNPRAYLAAHPSAAHVRLDPTPRSDRTVSEHSHGYAAHGRFVS